MQSPTMSEALSQLNTSTTERITNLKNRIDFELSLEQRLKWMIQGWNESCIAWFSSTQVEHYDQHGVQLRAMFKKMASEMGRPYITAQEHTHHEGNMIELMVPKSKRTHNVIAPLLLVTHDITPYRSEPWYVHQKAEGHDVCREERPGSWIIWFIGKSGLAQFNAFRDRCKTDTVCRIALGLTSKGN